MPYTVRNTFNAQTPLGSGIQALTRGLFGGATPAEQEAKLAAAEYSRAHADQSRALTDATRQKIAREQAADAAMAAAPAEVIAGLFGGKPQGDAIMAFRSGAQVDAPMGTGMTGSLDEQDVPAAKMAAPRPEFYTPDAEARANRTLAGIAAARALPGNDNAAQLAKIIEGLYNDDIRQRAVSGGVDAPTLQRIGQASAAVAGKPLFNDGQFGATSNFTGEIVDPRLFNASVALSGGKLATEGARQGAYRAQAGASGAQARLSDAKTEDVRESKKMVPALDALGNAIIDMSTGQPVTMRADQRGQVMARGAQDRLRDAEKPQKEVAPKPPVKVDRKVILSELNRLTGANDKDRQLDQNFAGEVMARAEALAQDQNGEFWNKPIGAVNAALTELTGGKELTDVSPGFTYFDSSKRFAPQGYKPKTAPNPNARQVAPPAQGGAPVKITGDADFNKLPKGAQYIGPDGVLRMK